MAGQPGRGAVATGDVYSQRRAAHAARRGCNDIGQVYGGPVVAVVDANTYSAGDLFAAGFVDNGIGPLVTVGEATGAGGANVWEPADGAATPWWAPTFEQQELPGGIGYTRRGAAGDPRRRRREGAAIEDVGVRGHRTLRHDQSAT